MEYPLIRQAVFLRRPNRFVAQVLLDGQEETVHVKNTGRCGELLLPGVTVYLEDFTGRMGTRKLRYSLVAVEKRLEKQTSLLVNMDAQAPNKVAQEALMSGLLPLPGMGTLTLVRPEAVCGASRLDFYLEDAQGRTAYLEIKGVTLEKDGVASFPDAPTLRGIKHLRELAALARAGVGAYVLFVIQMEQMHCFRPNRERHADFATALEEAAAAGVQILAWDCAVTPASLALRQPITVLLGK